MPLRLVLLGAPGSGKGTLTSRLLKQMPRLNSISTGDLLRAEIQNSTPIGKLADAYIKEGKLLPDELMAGMVETELAKRDIIEKSFLLDGFPRTPSQALELERRLQDNNINLVVELDVPPDVIVGRIANRWMHSSGRVYNLEYNPPKVPFKDDVTGEPLFQRPDDNPETVRKRLNTYYEQLEPIKRFYQSRGVYEKVGGETIYGYANWRGYHKTPASGDVQRYDNPQHVECRHLDGGAPVQPGSEDVGDFASVNSWGSMLLQRRRKSGYSRFVIFSLTMFLTDKSRRQMLTGGIVNTLDSEAKLERPSLHKVVVLDESLKPWEPDERLR
ncbi:hypothetical protein KL944_003137 [Ogataea haglerorum]|nr:hypothetical protein KL944_003137 [Ogataea haglerorum]